MPAISGERPPLVQNAIQPPLPAATSFLPHSVIPAGSGIYTAETAMGVR